MAVFAPRSAARSATQWRRTPLTSPFAGYISCIALDPSNEQPLWVTSSEVPAGGSMVSRSDNGGTSWISCSAGLPPIPKNSLVVDPANSNRIWVAADIGVYQSTNIGASWNTFSAGLPNAMAVDLNLHQSDRKLFCAIRNRGVWVVPVP